jgi:hypothetical protein
MSVVRPERPRCQRRFTDNHATTDADPTKPAPNRVRVMGAFELQSCFGVGTTPTAGCADPADPDMVSHAALPASAPLPVVVKPVDVAATTAGAAAFDGFPIMAFFPDQAAPGAKAPLPGMVLIPRLTAALAPAADPMMSKNAPRIHRLISLLLGT